MKDEGRAPGGLDPVRDRVPPQRSRWGRRSPYGHPRHDGAQGGDGRSAPTYAALDLGTNNCRLLVARPTHDSFRVVDAFSRIIRLGEGVSTSGRISDAAVDRAIGALTICRDKMRNRGVTRARLIATEACRAAANGAEFRARIAAEVGLELEIVDRETEATLAATGCTPLIDPGADAVVLFDIGGGSSESRPSAWHVGNGNHHRRRASRAQTLRAPARRRLLDARRRSDAGDRAPAGLEL